MPKIDSLLHPLEETPALYETLLAYLDEDLDVGRAARRLHLHPNSLRYRLAQIERRLGRSLRSPATIANLYLATLATKARSREAGSPSDSGAGHPRGRQAGRESNGS